MRFGGSCWASICLGSSWGDSFYGEAMGWQRQSHIYKTPFYYIDYCLAQTVALEFWARDSKRPPDGI